ncbi:tetratricopeptide repeat protein [Streptomyces olivochromogenes]|uniref:Tetratricopeptide repeat protein n=1 Tax=Streptomyces olivochromogenes TaxID=1963 RepID=A0A286PH80_STROL|nr:tetratricopeptide repeat protein [Streptomyces olivochromogenes]GAX58909.1 hypothetical protein SO3561_10484 [Streptomyces olivochromogenes]
MREEAGDREGAEALARQVADRGSTDVLYRLAEMREEAGDREGAEALLRQAADHDNTEALYELARMREVHQKSLAIRPGPGRYADTSMATAVGSHRARLTHTARRIAWDAVVCGW